MGKHVKSEDYNEKPYDPNASVHQKADEFDKQYMQNHRPSDHPNLDAYENQRDKK